MKWVFFSGVTWIYFSSPFFFLLFSLLLYSCVASKQRASPLPIIKGLYSSLASLPQSASDRPQHPQPAAMFMDEMSRAAYRKDGSQPEPTK